MKLSSAVPADAVAQRGPSGGGPQSLRPEWTPAVIYAIALNFGFAALLVSAQAQFVGPAYDWMRPWLQGFALLMLAASAFGALALIGPLPLRVLPIALVSLAAPLLFLGAGFASQGLLGGPIFYGADGAVLVWMAVMLARGRQPARPIPLHLTVGIGQLCQGVAMLIAPAQYANSAVFGAFPTYRPLIAVLWIVAGSALLFAQLRPDRRLVLFAVAFAALNYGLYASFFAPTRTWTGVVAYSMVVPFLFLSLPIRLSWRSASIVFAGLAALLALAAAPVISRADLLVNVGLCLALAAVLLAARARALVSVALPAVAIACVLVAGRLEPLNGLQTQGVIGISVAAWLLAWKRWRWSSHLAAAIDSWILGLALIGLLVQIVDLSAVQTTSTPIDLGTTTAVMLAGIVVALAAMPQIRAGPVGGRVFAGLGVVVVLVALEVLIASAGQAAALRIAVSDPPGAALLARVTTDAVNGILLMIVAAIVITGVATTRTVTRPIGAMVDVMDRFGRDSAVRLDPFGNDEISRAQRAFNRMADQLSASRGQLQVAHDELRALNAELEARVERRTAELVAATKELESFSYSVSHDLRAPLRSIDGFSAQLLKKYDGHLDEEGRKYLAFVRQSSQEMGQLIDDLLRLSMISRSEMRHERVDISALARDIVADLQRSQPGHHVSVDIEPGLMVNADLALVRAALQNLLGNAWKFSARAPAPCIAFGSVHGAGPRTYFVKDNGAGFDMTYAQKLFTPFQRLHSQEEFPGTGIGLATVHRVVRRHGGTIEAEGIPGQGATFRFTFEPAPAALVGRPKSKWEDGAA
jgi:signal transduction histidine kinase